MHAKENREPPAKKHAQKKNECAPQFRPIKYKDFLGGVPPSPRDLTLESEFGGNKANARLFKLAKVRNNEQKRSLFDSRKEF